MKSKNYNQGSLTYKFFLLLVSQILRRFIKLNVHGTLDDIKQDRGLIVITNHYSRIDMLIVMSVLPVQVHPVMTKDICVSCPNFLRTIAIGIAKILGSIIVDRNGESNLGAVKKMLLLLKAGQTVLIAPEGDRSNDMKLTNGKKGVALLALKTCSSILPIVTYGYQDFLQKVLMRQMVIIDVVVGRPFHVTFNNHPRNDELEEVTHFIMVKLAELLPTEYQGAYAKSFI